MNITLANLESFQEAVKQASKVQKCSTASERLKLADSMRKGVTCDFFQLQLDDYEEEEQDETEEIEENNSHAGDDNSKGSFRSRLLFYFDLRSIHCLHAADPERSAIHPKHDQSGTTKT